MLAHFQHGGHEAELAIYITSIYGTLQGRVKSNFVASEHCKSNGMYANSI